MSSNRRLRRCLAALRRLPRDHSGSAAILVGLTLPVLVGFGMLSIDVGAWYWYRRDLQTAVDAAALAAAFAVDEGKSPREAALSDAVRNGFRDGPGTIVVQAPPSSGPGSDDPTAVAVTLEQPVPLFFARVLGEGRASVSVTAAAAALDFGQFCVLGLDPTAARTVFVSGNGSVQLTCGIAVNSNSSSAFHIGGSASVEATTARIVGDISISGNPARTWTEAEPRTGRRPVNDPYADLEVPPVLSCDEKDVKVKPKEDLTLDPGGAGVMTLCGGLDVKGTLSLEPGIYIVDGGEVKINSGARLTGTDVTIILTGQGSDYATIHVNGGAEVDLRAPTSGDWTDIVLFQDPNAINGGSKGNVLNGSGSLHLEGVAYFPSQDLTVNGTGDAEGSCMVLVARTVSFSGNSDTLNTCPSRDVPKITATRLTLIR